MAHGDFPPKRGGISVNAGEMTLEFVVREGMVVVYLDDHGEPVRAQGAEATLVLTGSDGAERAIRMRVAGANAFEASDVAVKTGERLLFFAKMSDGQVHVGQLTAPERYAKCSRAFSFDDAEADVDDALLYCFVLGTFHDELCSSSTQLSSVDSHRRKRWGQRRGKVQVAETDDGDRLRNGDCASAQLRHYAHCQHIRAAKHCVEVGPTVESIRNCKSAARMRRRCWHEFDMRRRHAELHCGSTETLLPHSGTGVIGAYHGQPAPSARYEKLANLGADALMRKTYQHVDRRGRVVPSLDNWYS